MTSKVMTLRYDGRIYDIPVNTPPNTVIGYLYNDLGLNIFNALQMLSMLESAERNTGLRVQVNPDGTFDIVDFTLPSSAGRLRQNIPQEDVPKHVIEAVAMLQIAEEGSYVKGIGFRVSDSLYYVADNWGET